MSKRKRKFTGPIRSVVYLAVTILLIGAVDAWGQTACKDAEPIGRPSLARSSQKPRGIGATEIKDARRRLAELGYWVKAEGTRDEASLRHALIAFQKVEDRPRTGVLNQNELHALRAAQVPTPRESGYPHIEIDLCRQVLFLVDADDAPIRILPVSTGSGEYFTEGGRTRLAITPTGRFTVKRKITGWHQSPLGLLYYPSYIYGGVAIHGNPSVPPVPASHGCIRIPMFAAEEFSELAVFGMVVLVYDSRNIPLEP